MSIQFVYSKGSREQGVGSREQGVGNMASKMLTIDLGTLYLPSNQINDEE
ncbi:MULTISPECIES: hypothetical protein [unclassified Moorena]|nr:MULTISPECIES: hypothetical protein [unclassified Moorena]